MAVVPAPTLLGNSIFTWTAALGAAFGVLGSFYGLGLLLVRFQEQVSARAGTWLGNCLGETLGATRILLLLVPAAYVGSLILTLPEKAEARFEQAAVVSLLAQGGLWGNHLVGCWLKSHFLKRNVQSETAAMAAPVLGFILRLGLWTLLLLLALDAFSVNFTALVASLGVGGIAVALAVQSILGDIFASLSIALDKPFVLGDFIILGDIMGTVDYIGLKSTRIHSLSGEQIIISNTDLLKSRIRNFKRMSERRVVFTFGVSYSTDAARLAMIPEQVKSIVQGQEKTRFDRAHFKEFGDSALVYEVVYFIDDPDYNLYMDIQQAINVGIFRQLERDGVAFAHPTRIVVPPDKPRRTARGRAPAEAS